MRMNRAQSAGTAITASAGMVKDIMAMASGAFRLPVPRRKDHGTSLTASQTRAPRGE
jgi:hypothetical protein